MKKLIMVFIALLLIGLMVSACSGVQTVLDSVLVQAGVNLKLTQTAAAPSSADEEIVPPGSLNKIPTPVPALSSSAGDVLFEDDFSDPESGWNATSDEVSTNRYVDGGYTIKVDKKDFCAWATIYRTFSDTSIEVDAQKIGGSGYDEFGVVCRSKDNTNHYYLGITSDGFYGIGKLGGDEWADLSDENWNMFTNAINPSTRVNHIKATCDFDHLTLEVNGRTLLEAMDADYRSGEVGLYVCAYDTPGVEVLFDNYLVTSP